MASLSGKVIKGVRDSKTENGQDRDTACIPVVVSSVF